MVCLKFVQFFAVVDRFLFKLSVDPYIYKTVNTNISFSVTLFLSIFFFWTIDGDTDAGGKDVSGV